ncbi:hypothetical protein ABNX05_10735 [Lysinibacillus sp. M3]|uniref:Uncharacterized protein n=2 Tax=Lysinibacillus zambalensis TaxID=3160866 RepID=A0ABV1MRG3_9BACI
MLCKRNALIDRTAKRLALSQFIKNIVMCWIEKGMGIIGLLNIITAAFGISMITLFIFLWSTDEDKWSLKGISSYAVPVAFVYFVVFVLV